MWATIASNRATSPTVVRAIKVRSPVVTSDWDVLT